MGGQRGSLGKYRLHEILLGQEEDAIYQRLHEEVVRVGRRQVDEATARMGYRDFLVMLCRAGAQRLLDDPPPPGPLGPPPLPIRPIRQVQGELLQAALQAAGGNRRQAAAALGVSVRTVRNWLRVTPSVTP